MTTMAAVRRVPSTSRYTTRSAGVRVSGACKGSFVSTVIHGKETFGLPSVGLTCRIGGEKDGLENAGAEDTTLGPSSACAVSGVIS